MARRGRKKTHRAHGKRAGQRPLKVLMHFYHKNERRQAALRSLIHRRGGRV